MDRTRIGSTPNAVGLAISVSVWLVLTICPETSHADVVQLRCGGTIRGVVQNAPPRVTDKSVLIETLTGAELRFDESEIVGIERRSRSLEEYESLAKRIADTVEARWDLAEWCKRAGLSEPRREQLRRIVELDPEHKLARQALGHKHQGNRWVSPEQTEAELREAGYVKHKGQWITSLELEQAQADDKQIQRQKEWRPKLRLWITWLGDRDPARRSDALVRFRELRDPNAIPAIVDQLLNTNNGERRALAVQLLGQMEGDAAMPYLARTALGDADAALRKESFRSMTAAQRTAAVPIFQRALSNEENRLVRRAAFLLGEIGLKSAIPALIEALVTSHKTSIAVPQQQNSFDRDGNPAGSTSPLPPDVQKSLLAGQLPYGVQVQSSGPPVAMKVVTVRKSVQNTEVLDALKKLTKEDFGFNETAWRNWWRAVPR